MDGSIDCQLFLDYKGLILSTKEIWTMTQTKCAICRRMLKEGAWNALPAKYGGDVKDFRFPGAFETVPACSGHRAEVNFELGADGRSTAISGSV